MCTFKTLLIMVFAYSQEIATITIPAMYAWISVILYCSCGSSCCQRRCHWSIRSLGATTAAPKNDPARGLWTAEAISSKPWWRTPCGNRNGRKNILPGRKNHLKFGMIGFLNRQIMVGQLPEKSQLEEKDLGSSIDKGVERKDLDSDHHDDFAERVPIGWFGSLLWRCSISPPGMYYVPATRAVFFPEKRADIRSALVVSCCVGSHVYSMFGSVYFCGFIDLRCYCYEAQIVTSR